MSEAKTYAPGSVKEHTFHDGGSVLKIGANAEKLIAFIQTHANSKGYINLCVSKRKSVGQYGETHCMWLDTWEPKSKASPEDVQRGVSNMRKAVNPDYPNSPIEDDDVPF